MAVAIEKRFGVKPELVGSKGGVFDVVANGRRLFSKHEEGRFPEDGEVLAALASLA